MRPRERAVGEVEPVDQRADGMVVGGRRRRSAPARARRPARRPRATNASTAASVTARHPHARQRYGFRLPPRSRLRRLDRPRRRREQLKLVIGIVRPEKANDVLEALYRAEVRGFSMSRVQGHGGELDRVETYRGTTVQMGLSDKVRFEIAVSDTFVRADDRGALRRRAHRRGRRRQDLRRAARARGPHPHRRDRPRRRHPGGQVTGLPLAASAVDTGDTAWMLIATALVLMMTPALGLFYAGLVRSKNTLNTFMMCDRRDRDRARHLGGGRLLARLRRGQRRSSAASATRSCTTSPSPRARARRSRTCSSSPSRRPSASSPRRSSPGAVVERMRFGAFLVFAALWSVLVYAVLAHWAFGGGLAVRARHARLRRRHPGRDGLRVLGAGGGAGRRRAQGLRAPGAAAAQRRLRAARRRPAVVRLVRLQRRQWLLDRATRACSRSPTRC